MVNRILKPIIILAAISLIGVVITQVFWLSNSVTISEKQFDDRVDRMMTDLKNEIRSSIDTSIHVKQIPQNDLKIFDLIDTVLLANLFNKYVAYHKLGTNFHYAIAESLNNMIVYQSPGYRTEMEHDSYKTCLSFAWKKEYMHLSVYFPDKKKNIYMKMISWIILSVVFILIITGAFIFIIYGLMRQKKITEVKNDFINNMTHEFKTPISTISLASEMLMKLNPGQSGQKTGKYARIIFDENKRMQSQIDLILQTAASDRDPVQLNKEPVNLHDLIKISVQNYSIENCGKTVSINYDLDAIKPVVSVDPVHIRNVIGNIVDNAIKYSGDTPEIMVTTKNTDNNFILSVTDKGIGIPKESLNKIFERFYRVSTGNIHNVKGFGLGLYYVKSVIDAHQGIVIVNSNINNGSTFSVILPQYDLS